MNWVKPEMTPERRAEIIARFVAECEEAESKILPCKYCGRLVFVGACCQQASAAALRDRKTRWPKRRNTYIIQRNRLWFVKLGQTQYWTEFRTAGDALAFAFERGRSQ